jgi:RHS repeat-associated protein
MTESGGERDLVVGYEYDTGGRLIGITYPTGTRVAYDRYAATQEVITVRNAVSGAVYADQIRKVAGGPLRSLVFPGSVPLYQGFNFRWEQTLVRSGPVNLQYTPTPAGDVGQIVDGPLPQPFAYDFLDRLTGSTGWFTYGYDWNGNRSSESLEGTSLTNAYAFDRLTTSSTAGTTPVARYAYGYDYQSNLSGIGKYNTAGTAMEKAVCLRHDALGRLVTVGTALAGYVSPDATTCTNDSFMTAATAKFKYDFRNRRIASWRATTNEWVYTFFDQAGQPLAELARTSDPLKPWRPVREYVWLEGRPIAQIEYDAATGASRSYSVHTDAIGMPRALASPTGATVWTASVPRPFGDITETTTPDPETGKTVVTNLRLPGQYDERLLASVGLQGPYYNWNRWYLPSVGRYLELDPIAKEGSFNTALGVDWYAYASGNPMRWVDRRGEEIFSSIQMGDDVIPGGCGGMSGCVDFDSNSPAPEPCRLVGCKYKFDVYVDTRIWRQFVSEDAKNWDSTDSPGMTVAQHEDLHVADFTGAFGSALNGKYQTEGFSTKAACECKRAGFSAWFAKYSADIEKWTRRHDKHR